MKLPSIYVSHGAPTFALEPGTAGALLADVGQRVLSLADVRAVLMISPHWQTEGLQLGASAQPETIHDFRGFAAPLYQLQYPAPGAPAVAQEVAAHLAAAGLPSQLIEEQGLDHGAWVPLMHMFPEASLPVVQLSLPLDLSGVQAVALGHALAPLRSQGILIMGSGCLTHNLAEFRLAQSDLPAAYVDEFVQWTRHAVIRHDEAALSQFHDAPHGKRAHPTDEHFLPLLVVLGSRESSETVEVIEGGVTHSVLSMEGYVFGSLPLPAAGRIDNAAPAAQAVH